MASAESLLAAATEDGSFPIEEWPRTLAYIVKRLEEVVTEFPRPTHPPPEPPSLASLAGIRAFGYNGPSPTSSQAADAGDSSVGGDKENAPPATPPRQPIATPEDNSGPLSWEAPETVTLYNIIVKSLTQNFAKKPPHTIQRLAELILYPKRHYKFLPQYLRALDRIVSVSSNTSIFPLPMAVLPQTGGLFNGTSSPSPAVNSDESLGGARLTPIPWLTENRGSQSEMISESTEMVDGPNGAGRIETVSVVNGQLTSTPATPAPQIVSAHPDGETLPSTGPVTQGEILRQEQEAGVLLSNPHAIHRSAQDTGNGNSIMQTVEGEDDAPHARGPEDIGLEDIGNQHNVTGHIDIEGAVGRPNIERSSKSPAPAPEARTEPDTEESKDQEMSDGTESTLDHKEKTEGREDVEMANNDGKA